MAFAVCIMEMRSMMEEILMNRGLGIDSGDWIVAGDMNVASKKAVICGCRSIDGN